MPERAEPIDDQPDNPGHTLIHLIAREEAHEIILQHLSLCPFNADAVQKRIRDLELRFSALLGFMIGSGLLGGVSGAVLAKLIK